MYTLLLVDDEEFALAALRHALPWEGYGFTDIHTATSSQDAWEILTKQRIDACFIDIRMPGMTGLELLAEAGRHKLETLFVVVSGYSDFSYAKQAIQFGVLDYCLKPVSEEECRPVLEKLARHIPLNRISHDPAYASRLLAEPEFCSDFLSGLTAGGSDKLTLLLVRSPKLNQILRAADSLLPARAFFLGEDEAFLIWNASPDEDAFVPFLESWEQSALLIYGGTSPEHAFFQNAFRRMRVICHSQGTAPTGMVKLPAVNEETTAYLAGILSYIEENYASHLTLQDLAHQFGVNYSYLSQLFKKATNQTFEKHLANIRLTHSCRLLSDTYMPIADIAEQVGFRDYHYFCTAFKRFCSMTPSQYRDAHSAPPATDLLSLAIPHCGHVRAIPPQTSVPHHVQSLPPPQAGPEKNLKACISSRNTPWPGGSTSCFP